MDKRFYKIVIYLCILDVLLMVYIYPFYLSSAGWTIVTLSNLALVVYVLVSKKIYRYNKKAVIWGLTLFPLILNNFSLRNGEFGFTLLWLFFILLLLIIDERNFWIKPSLKLIYVFCGFYSVTTIIFNFKLAGVLENIAYIYRGFHPIDVGTLATAGFTRHYSHNGLYIATGFIIACSALLSKKSKMNLLVTSLFFIGLLFTQKRGPLLAALISVILVYLITNNSKLSKKIFVFLIGVAVTIVGVYVGYILFPKLFAVIDRFSTDNLLTGRQYLWDEALDMFMECPLWGVGFGAYPHKLSVVIDTIKVTNLNAHNIYLQILAETGIIGFLCFMIPMLFSLINTLTFLRNNRMYLSERTTMVLLFSSIMQLFFLVNGITENSLYDRVIYVPYLLSVAYYISIYKSVKKKICIA